MAKYDWKQLEREFILSDYKSVNKFLKSKSIQVSGNTKKMTKDWKEKKVQKEYQKSTKIIEKVTEKEIDNTVEKIFEVKELAKQLGFKIQDAMDELDKRIKKTTTKTKIVHYDILTKKPTFEEITEKEKYDEYITLIDKKGLKELTSALKDINDILNNKDNNGNQGKSLADVIQEAFEKETKKEEKKDEK